MIDDVAMPLRDAATQKGIDLHIRLSKDVPNKVLGDATLIANLLTSLVANAVERTERGKVNLEVSKESESESKLRLRFRVADSGAGLSESELGNLLSGFSKEKSTLGGNGIEGHSTAAEGSAFWFDAELERASTLLIEGAHQNGAGFRHADGVEAGISPPTGEGSEMTYDRKHLLDSVDGNADLAREIVTLYLAESPGMVTELGKNVERQDRQGIESTAHRLRGAMLAMGAGAAVIAADLEELAQTGQLVNCPERFAILAARARALDEALINQELGGVPPTKS
jgi:HPt (histidine-containing phosphotransfer) domain-containing protein